MLLDGLDLVNDGWTEVFDHLRSLPSSQSDIVEIDLRGCRLKDNDLLAISAFLTNNQTLKCLWLQNVRDYPRWTSMRVILMQPLLHRTVSILPGDPLSPLYRR